MVQFCPKQHTKHIKNMVKMARNRLGRIWKDKNNNKNGNEKPIRQLFSSWYSSFKKMRQVYLKNTQYEEHVLYDKNSFFSVLKRAETLLNRVLTSWK